jgi:DNA-3-methyladenine glycosylase I
MKRCGWAERGGALDRAYHDEEWGVPSRDDRHLFEMVILEGAQAGLSWSTILNKRANYGRAFARFDPRRVARFGAADVKRLLGDAGIVRNRAKVAAAIANARATLDVQREHGSLANHVWQFVGGRPVQNRWSSLSRAPAATDESMAMSKELSRRGFKFVGPTICYAFMQAVGMVNDHEVGCFRHAAVARLANRDRPGATASASVRNSRPDS